MEKRRAYKDCETLKRVAGCGLRVPGDQLSVISSWERSAQRAEHKAANEKSRIKGYS